MIDFHSHILPGIDDGSRDVDETKQLIYEEINQGVTRIIATPHFYAQKSSAKQFLEARAKSESKLREALQDIDRAPEVRVAAEVYYFPGISRAEILSEYPPGTQPRSYMFPRRNRLIAVASDEVYVIDVGRRSGTETTVESCHRYGRTVRYQMVSATI